ncbi:MAG: hypothetical protein CM15mP74_03510 [Halieaceae bacterium]|nr:MAG: hypothetical protein CM15mP74_03510 [Halieaceae bacterium]
MRTLPIYLEYLTMCVDAGLDLPGAMKQAVDKGPRGAIRNEFRVILRDISSGYTRADALARFDERMSLPEITSLVSAVTQANKMGSSLFDTLQSQAEQRLDERFRRAEKMAMEAPVKLIVPLVIFIFPLTFIILLFPIVTRFTTAGRFERVNLTPSTGKYFGPEGYCQDFVICIADNFISRAIGLIGRREFDCGDALHIARCSAIHTFYADDYRSGVLGLQQAGDQHSQCSPPWRLRHCWGPRRAGDASRQSKGAWYLFGRLV